MSEKILSEAEVDEFERRASLWDYPRLEKEEMLRAVYTIRALREGLRAIQESFCRRDCETWTNGYRSHCDECAKARELLGGSDERS